MDDVAGKLAAAGVASHLVRVTGAAGRLEKDVLDALLSAFSGTVFRIAPFLYALDAVGEAGDRGAAVEAALAALLGDGAAELSEIEPPSDAGDPWEGRAVTLLRAMSRAVDGAVRSETPECRAVVDAEFALAAARLTADGLGALGGDGAPGLAARLGRIEDALAAISARTEGLEDGGGREAELPALLARLDEIEQACLGLAERLAAWPGPADSPPDAGAVLETLPARLDAIERRLAALASAPALAPDQMASFNRFSVALQAVLRRLDAQADAVEAAVARVSAGPAAGARPEGDAGPPGGGFDELREGLARMHADAQAAERRTAFALAELIARLEMAGVIAGGGAVSRPGGGAA
jgi:hypothetical protein